MKNDREYRNLKMQIRAADGAEPTYIVEGYASTFDRYKLLEIDGKDYNEQIMRNAFDEADLSDVVFRVDHEGPVYARTSAGTVTLDINEHGLHNITDLSKTKRSRDMFEEIAAGNYPQMSFAFSVAEDHFDADTRTRIIDRINKVFDISAVSFPANPNTEIQARAYFDGVIKEAEAERLLLEERKRRDFQRREELKRKIMEGMK